MKNCHSLTQLIITDLSSIKNVSDSVAVIHKFPLKLQLLQKKQIFYLSDGEIVIQAIMSLSNSIPTKQECPKPFNRIRTNFYNFQTKQANLFLFNQEDDQSDNRYPSPYEPKFHFQERISHFDCEIAKSELANITQALLVQMWAIRIVNIANTGYYGVALEIMQYERLREKIANSPSLHSVLYQKQISSILDKLRINDMRQEIGDPKLKRPISLCYYRKNIKANSINKAQSNFVKADLNGKFAKVDLSSKKYHIPIGEIQGVLRFTRPLKEIQSQKKTLINFSKFRELPEHSIYVGQEQEKSINQSSESECEEIQTANQIEEEYPEAEDEDQSLQDDEEILKMIYSKQLQKMTIL